jgi:hypothetical protein
MSSPATADARLLAIAFGPVNSISDVISALESIDGILADEDGLKWFNWLYLTVTRAVDQSVASAAWHNPAWIAQLDVVFARLYLDAVRQWLTPGLAAPKCWQVLFKSRNDVRVARVQFAIAGVNAHIDHDLSIAIVKTCQQFGIQPVHLSNEYRDYCHVNDVLDPIIDRAKAMLLTGLLGNCLPHINLVEDLVAGFGLRAVREAAWANGEMLNHVDAMPGLGDRFMNGLDDAAALAAHGLLAPVGI